MKSEEDGDNFIKQPHTKCTFKWLLYSRHFASSWRHIHRQDGYPPFHTIKHMYTYNEYYTMCEILLVKHLARDT